MKNFKILVLILATGIILSACSSNTETPQTTMPPEPTTLPAATQMEVSTPTPAEESGQGVPTGYPPPLETATPLVNTGYPAPTEVVPPLTNVGYPAPGTFNLVLADGSEQVVYVDVLNALPKVTVSFNGTEMDVLGLMDALKKYNVETANQITARGVDNASLNLTEDQIAAIRKIIENNHKVEGDLRKDVTSNIKRLMDLSCYRGVRHKRGLPVRGQNTRANARTRKGPRKTVAGKKSVKALK